MDSCKWFQSILKFFHCHYLKTGSLDSTRLKDLLLLRIHTFFKQHLDLYDFTFIFLLVHVPLMNF